MSLGARGWRSIFCFQAEDGIRDAKESRGLGDVYKRQAFGRKRFFEGGNLASDAANYPVQTTAGDLNNTSSIILDDLVDLRIAVHDSLIIQYPLGEEAKYGEIVKSVMSRPITELGGYQFAVSIEYGSTWGDLQDLTEGDVDEQTDEEEDDEDNEEAV